MTESRPAAPATISARDERGALRFALAPLLVLVLSHGVFALTAFELPALSESLGPSLADGRSLRETRPLVESRARLSWSTTILLFYAVTLSVLLYSVTLLARSLSRRGFRLYLTVGILLSAAALGQAAYSGIARDAFSTIYYFTFDSLRGCGCFDAAELGAIKLAVGALNLLAGLVPIILMAACSALAGVENEREGRALARIESRMRRIKSVLAGGSAVLFAGVLHQVVWLRWPAALVEDATVSGDIVAFSESLSVYWGTTYTLMLAALYVPAAWSLNRRARAVIEREPGRTGSLEPEEWLRKHGLSVAPARQLPQVAALLAPLVAGPLGSALPALVSNLGQ